MDWRELQQGRYPGKGRLIAEQIVGLIRKGVYKPGDKLPPERAIAEQMKVGRPAVREALSALQIVGLLETRLGDGTYVSAGQPPSTGQPPSVGQSIDGGVLKALRLLEAGDSPFEVIQVRKAVEIGIIHLAVRNHDQDDLREIKRLLQVHLEHGRAGRYREFIASSRDFHLALARAGKSVVLTELMDQLLDMVNQPLWQTMREAFLAASPDNIRPRLEIHEQLVEALEGRDFLRCVELLEAHFDGLMEENYDLKGEPTG